MTVDHCIKSTWHNLFRMYNQLGTPHGITQATGVVLLCISEEGTPSTSIAPSLGVEVTSMSRLIKKMEQENLIYRRKDKKDKRMVRIFLTKDGLKKKALAKELVFGFNELIEEEIPQSKLSLFFEVIDSINGVIYKHREQNKLL